MRCRDGRRSLSHHPFDASRIGCESVAIRIVALWTAIWLLPYPVCGDPWMQEAKLTASDGAAQHQLGTSVAVSGDTAVVGAILAGADNQGAAYVFTRSDGVWSEQAMLTASDGLAGDLFGTTVAIEGDAALVGAPASPGGAGVGAVYVFTRTGETWSQQLELTASNGVPGDAFGSSVALESDTALIGAGGSNDSVGAAYVFTDNGSGWSEQAKLVASDGAAGDLFGHSSVALSGDTALVGASQITSGGKGAAYVFVRDGETWSEQAKLTVFNGAAGDRFGESVALSGDTALAGAQAADAFQGAAWVFLRSDSEWSEQTKLTASDGTFLDRFGASVALSGTIALVGASEAGLGARGAAYVFNRQSDGEWSEQAKLTASDGGSVDRLGISAALSAGTALLGADLANVDGNVAQGAAYVFVTELGEPGPGVLEVDPIDLDFGDVPVGSMPIASLSVSNAAGPGADDLVLASVELTSGAPDFEITGGTCVTGTIVPPGSTCTVNVTFTPDAIGDFAGAVTVTTPDEQTAPANLTGSGVEAPPDPPVIDVEPDNLSATLEPGQSEDQILEIANLGAQALEWAIRLDASSVWDRARRSLLEDGVLLIPDSPNDRVMAFDPETGDLIDPDFIPSDSAVGTGLHVLLHPDGERFLLSDQLADVI